MRKELLPSRVLLHEGSIEPVMTQAPVRGAAGPSAIPSAQNRPIRALTRGNARLFNHTIAGNPEHVDTRVNRIDKGVEQYSTTDSEDQTHVD